MSALDHLGEMITESFRKRAAGNYLVLTEPDQEDYRVQVAGPHFALSLDKKPGKGGMDAALPFLKTEHAGLTCKCDLIVFAPHSAGQTVVFLLELKSLNVTGYLEQMRSSRAFANYLAEIGRVHGHDLGKLICKGVLIRSRRIPAKGGTRKRRVSFEKRSDLEVCEWDRAYPLGLHQLLQAA